ncbi:MAG: ATP-binding protein [Candidatus Eisenbacteria bacterium]
MPPKTQIGRNIFIPADCDQIALEGFLEELRTRLKDDRSEISVDCSLLEHTSSSHIIALWQALTRCEEAGVRMRLSSVGYGLERVLEVLDLYDLFVVDQKNREPEPTSQHAGFGPTPPGAFSMEFEASMDGVADALLGFHEFLKKIDVTEVCAFDLETVFYEVATNICRHGGLEQGSIISFAASLLDRHLCLRFTDAGAPFDPTGSVSDFNPREVIRKKQRHGLGLTMIRRLVDSLSYEWIDDGLNVVTLQKQLTLQRR